MKKPRIVLDIEVYRNYFLCQVMNIETGNVRAFEKYDGFDLDIETLRKVLRQYCVITFNGNNYDMVLVAMALSGASTETIKRASDNIIKNGYKFWHIEKQYGVSIPKWDHIDLFEVSPGRVGLKAYGGRMHSKRIKDLPIDPDSDINEAQREVLREYCKNDLITTLDLYRTLSSQIELREKMSDEYGIDLRSKSDAQIAEAVIKKEVEALRKTAIGKPMHFGGETFKYQVPDFISFETPGLQTMLERVRNADFRVAESGKVIEPSELKAPVSLGDGKYRMGIGGLHSSEKSASHKAEGDFELVDWDVASYYPAIILRLGLHPETMGGAFLTVYKSLVDRRLAAKASGDKTAADTLKITVNGSFGKFGSKYSFLYSPNLLIQTTVTGQLALLMLIEIFETSGIPVVSANTDGVVVKCPGERTRDMETIVAEWEDVTGFEMESTRYSAIYSRDVNNYIAIKEDGGVKLKGVYAKSGLMKNPSADICTEAVIDFLEKGVPIADTVCDCDDIRKFISIRSVTGGAIDQDGNYLGRVARWYYSTRRTGAITYKLNGNKVPTSDGASALMDIDGMPEDVDRLKYIDDAYDILKGIGYVGA